MMNDLHIGRVVETTGFSVVGELEASVDDLYRNYESRRYAVGQVGSIVKIQVGDRLVFGFVTGLRMSELSSSNGKTSGSKSDTKRLDLQLFGEGIRNSLDSKTFSFRRGVENHPLPGQDILIVTIDELKQIYAQSSAPSICIGTLSQASGLPVHLRLDDLLGKHFAILGTTGSGKSCGTALLIRRILESASQAHIILLDPHGEYGVAFSDVAEMVDPTALRVPHWLLNFEESIELFVGRTEHAATSQTNILKDAILYAKRTFPHLPIHVDEVTVDTPVPYRLSDVLNYVEKDKPSAPSQQTSHLKIIHKIKSLQNDKRYNFMILKDEDVSDDLKDLLCHLVRFPVAGKPIAIVDLSGVPSEIVDIIVSLVCRTVFDFCLWSGRPVSSPVLVVCEEAHRYAPRRGEAAFRGAKTSLSRIAKEGRKYGVSLGLVSQRPSELDETILSQCNTLLTLRMSNEADQNFVRRALPDGIQSAVDILPALRSQEALVVGEAAVVPFRVHFAELPFEHRPASQNVKFSVLWSEDSNGEDYVVETIRRWRRQERC